MTDSAKQFPLVTVAVVSYEQENELYGCLDSVLMQDYPNLELLLCDDGSRSFDSAKIREYVDARRKTNLRNFGLYHRSENGGTVLNCNAAVSNASGEIIKILAADDRLYAVDTISLIAAQFREHPALILAGRGRCYLRDGTHTEQYYPTGNEILRMKEAGPDEMLRLLCTRPWSCILAPAAAFRKDVFSEAGLFDTSYRYLEDWPFWIKACAMGIPIHICEQVFVWYRFGGVSSLQEKSGAAAAVQRTFLQECRQVLTREGIPRMKSTGGPWRVLQCRLSIDILHMREVRALDWAGWPRFRRLRYLLAHLPALLYQKILGAIGNSKYLPWKFALPLLLAGCLLTAIWAASGPGVWKSLCGGAAIVCGAAAAGYSLANGILWAANYCLRLKHAAK